MIVSFGFTITCYLLTMFLLPNYIDVSYIFNVDCMTKILMVTFISWFPFFAIGKIYKKKDEINN